MSTSAPEQLPQDNACLGPQSDDMVQVESQDSDFESFDGTASESDPHSDDDSDEEIADKYAKPDSELCGYCEQLVLLMIKNDRENEGYKYPDHLESFYRIKKSS